VCTRSCVYVLLFHLESILDLAYRCSTDDTTPVSFFFVFLFFLLFCQIIERLPELCGGSADRTLSYRLCHYNKRLNNHRTRIVIGNDFILLFLLLYMQLHDFFLFFFFVMNRELECTLCSKVNFVVLHSIICAIYIHIEVNVWSELRDNDNLLVLYDDDETISIYRHYITNMDTYRDIQFQSNPHTRVMSCMYDITSKHS
jgi:hypothetical protein